MMNWMGCRQKLVIVWPEARTVVSMAVRGRVDAGRGDRPAWPAVWFKLWVCGWPSADAETLRSVLGASLLEGACAAVRDGWECGRPNRAGRVRQP